MFEALWIFSWKELLPQNALFCLVSSTPVSQLFVLCFEKNNFAYFHGSILIKLESGRLKQLT